MNRPRENVWRSWNPTELNVILRAGGQQDGVQRSPTSARIRAAFSRMIN